MHVYTHMHVSSLITQCETCRSTQGIYNHPGIKCKNGCLEIASRFIDCFYLVDKIFAQFFLLNEKSIIYIPRMMVLN